MATRILNGLVVGSSRIPQDRFIEQQADTGKFRVRYISRRRHWQFTLIWKDRPKSDVDSVETLWRTTREQSFDYEWQLDGKTYTANFLEPPKSRLTSYNFWEIQVSLLGWLKS